MKTRRTLTALCAGILVVAAGVVAGAEPAGLDRIPKLRVPKLKTPPTLDGKIEPGEWRGAAGVSALVSACAAGGTTPTIAPPIQQATFYLGYDDKYLYLAMHSPHKEGTYPLARGKQNDVLNDILFEDHIEFQICKHSREQASTPPFGFYKITVNPRGTMADQWYYNGTDGSEDLWSTGGKTKCTVTPTYWDLEMSVDLAQLGLNSLDAKSLILWLARTDSCVGIYFLTWGPGTWGGWETMPEATFDPNAPAVQLAGVGDIMDGNPEVTFNLADTVGKARSLTGSLKIMNKAGQTVCEETAKAELPANGQATLRLAKQGVPIDDEGNTVVLEVKEGDTVLWYNKMPLIRLTETYRKNILEPWLKGRPQSGDWDCSFAYRAGDGITDCSADLDFFGMSEKLLKADACEVAIESADGKALVKDRFPIADRKGAMTLKTPVLPAGDYLARFTLLEGKNRLDSKEFKFVRKVFPWEGNKLGISDEVVPPYEPITVNTDKETGMPGLRVWNRQYLVGPNGLPARIVYGGSVKIVDRWNSSSAGDTTQLLRAPVRFEVDGAAAPADPKAKPAEIVKAAGHETVVQGAQTVGPLAIKTQATLEYDGWYEVEMEVSGVRVQGSGRTAPDTRHLKPDTISSLDLVLDLPAEFDTLYVHRDGDRRAPNNYFGAIPAGTGTVWASTSLAAFKDSLIPGKDWKSFVPVLFAGTGSRGVWFYAWSNKGWQLADGDAAVRVERDAKGGAPTLRIRLIAGGATLDAPRKIRFALLAAPVKPLPVGYRNWKMEHETAGYRFYGGSVNGYELPNDEAYEMERKRLLYGPQTDFAREYFDKTTKSDSRRKFATGRYAIFNNSPVVLYGSTSQTGAGLEEFDTFGGEWLGRSNWKGGVDHSSKGRPNYSGSVVWDTDRKCTVVNTQFTPSYIDCYVWHHKKLIEKGVNGTWWDMCSIGLIKEFDPETGTLDTVFNQYARRQLTKRLTTVNWQLMRRPCWLINYHEDFSFADVIWMVENDWSPDGAGRDLIEHMGLDTFRAMACTKTMQLVAKPWIETSTKKDDPRYEKVIRSIVGVLIAHDVHNFSFPHWARPYMDDTKLGRYLRFHVDFYDGAACQFRGYWDVPRTAVDTGDTDVTCSVYSNNGRKNAVLWLLNAGNDDKTLTGVTFSANVFGAGTSFDCRKAFDAETGAPLKFEAAGELVKGVKAFKLSEPVTIKKHEFRAIAVGAEE